MHDLLNKIVTNKKTEVTQNKEQVPPAALVALCEKQTPPRSLRAALQSPKQVAVLAEIKRASPSAGLIREDFDPVAIAQEYERNGAAAVSVITESRFFEGCLDYLSGVRTAVQLPLLRKDFIFEPYQLLEARASGADAILLILAMLSDSQAAELKSAASELQLDCLVEIHTEKELSRALALNSDLIGINNRDLHTFEVSLTVTERLLSLVPETVTVVSESGYKSSAEVAWLGKIGGDAVLIGEHLMRNHDAGLALKELTGMPKWSR